MSKKERKGKPNSKKKNNSNPKYLHEEPDRIKDAILRSFLLSCWVATVMAGAEIAAGHILKEPFLSCLEIGIAFTTSFFGKLTLELGIRKNGEK